MTFAVMANTPGVLATDSMIPDCFTVMIAIQTFATASAISVSSMAFATAIAVSISRMTYSLAAGAATAAVTCTVSAATTFCIGRGHWE